MSGAAFFVFCCAIGSLIIAAVFFFMASGNEALIMESVGFLVVGGVLLFLSIFAGVKEGDGVC